MAARAIAPARPCTPLRPPAARSEAGTRAARPRGDRRHESCGRRGVQVPQGRHCLDGWRKLPRRSRFDSRVECQPTEPVYASLSITSRMTSGRTPLRAVRACAWCPLGWYEVAARGPAPGAISRVQKLAPLAVGDRMEARTEPVTFRSILCSLGRSSACPSPHPASG